MPTLTARPLRKQRDYLPGSTRPGVLPEGVLADLDVITVVGS